MTIPLIEARRISVRLNGALVLDHVSLQIRPGEILCVIGPNGSGKTTLVRSLLGLQALTEGEIRRAPSLHIGYVPQKMPIDPTFPLSVERFLGMANNNRQAIRRTSAEAGLAPDALTKPLHALSGGEFQRALLAHALLREPTLLVLDEPTQGVDVTGQSELYQLIDRLRKSKGFGVLLVSHDLHLVMAASDHILCLNRHVCCEGKPEAVSQHPEYLAMFGPQAGLALAPYTHHHDHRHD